MSADAERDYFELWKKNGGFLDNRETHKNQDGEEDPAQLTKFMEWWEHEVVQDATDVTDDVAILLTEMLACLQEDIDLFRKIDIELSKHGSPLLVRELRERILKSARIIQKLRDRFKQIGMDVVGTRRKLDSLKDVREGTIEPMRKQLRLEKKTFDAEQAEAERQYEADLHPRTFDAVQAEHEKQYDEAQLQSPAETPRTFGAPAPGTSRPPTGKGKGKTAQSMSYQHGTAHALGESRFGPAPGKFPGLPPGTLITAQTLYTKMREKFIKENPTAEYPRTYKPGQPGYIPFRVLPSGAVYCPGNGKGDGLELNIDAMQRLMDKYHEKIENTLGPVQRREIADALTRRRDAAKRVRFIENKYGQLAEEAHAWSKLWA